VSDTPRLLVVDEDPQTRALLALLLGGEGYRVELAPALNADAARRADLVVADGRYTTQAAFEAAAPAIVAAAAGAPVVLLSALALDPAQARAHGFRDLVPKPFDIDELLDTVGRLLAPDAD